METPKATWWETIRFGREQGGAKYVGWLFAAGGSLFIEVGVWIGFIGWVIADPIAGRDYPLFVYVGVGAFFGLLAAVGGGPGSLRIAIELSSSTPGDLFQRLKRTLLADGYEPVEVSEMHCKLDYGVGFHGIGFGPAQLRPNTTYVMLVVEESNVLIAAPCDVLVNLPELRS